jgi:cold shock protein
LIYNCSTAPPSEHNDQEKRARQKYISDLSFYFSEASYLKVVGFQCDRPMLVWEVALRFVIFCRGAIDYEGCETAAPLPHEGNPMPTGVVRWFNLNNGFGYIHPDVGGPDVFVHISAIERAGLPALVVGHRVAYELLVDKRSGKFSAYMLQLQT